MAIIIISKNSSTPLTNQFVEDNNAWYYVNASGQRTTGWIYVNGYYYYLDPSTGAMVTGWIQLNNIWYYLGADGAMYTGTHTINGSEYTFNSDGSVVTSAWVGNKYYELMAYGFHITKTKTGEKIPMVTGISVLMVLTLSVSGKVSMGIGTISMPVDI